MSTEPGQFPAACRRTTTNLAIKSRPTGPLAAKRTYVGQPAEADMWLKALPERLMNFQKTIG